MKKNVKLEFITAIMMQTALIRKDHSIAHVSMGTLVMVSLV